MIRGLAARVPWGASLQTAKILPVPNAASARVIELGLTIPQPAQPVANYVPYKILRDNSGPYLLYTSGMVPLVDGQPLMTGHLGANISVEQGQECARLCVLNALSWVQHAARQGLDGLLGLNGLDHVREVVQVRGFVASTPEFADHPKVINGASDLLVDIFGDAGRHTRAAVGCSSLPMNVPVEIDFLFAL
jgi:enamine deaminase RidA (YjgF/YER057c/UK114 family)